MPTDLSASAVSAGALISTSTFEIPQYQREYAWTREEYEDFWDDLCRSLLESSYFLGLVILTGKGPGRKQVVDGQQRLITLTLLASALHVQAVGNGRSALAAAIKSDFLRAIDYATDDLTPRLKLADPLDDAVLQDITSGKGTPVETGRVAMDGAPSSMSVAYEFLAASLARDLREDPFRRLGLWTDFLTNKLEFAVFLHPDPASAYRVFEVVNTRGRHLTTADLLKNYILSQTPGPTRDEAYSRWQTVSRSLTTAGSNTLVQYIRHVMTVVAGYVRPKDLFDYVAGRRQGDTTPPSSGRILTLLEQYLPLYAQMVDPTLEGPATARMLRVFQALNELSVIVVRPLLLAIAEAEDAEQGMDRVLDLVVRRIVVGSLGTGNVERRLSLAAHAVHRDGRWQGALAALQDLDPKRDEFELQLSRRSLSRATLQFMRRSIIQGAKAPAVTGWLQYLRTRQAGAWGGFNDDNLVIWGLTLGNTILTDEPRRPLGATTWHGVKEHLLPNALPGEWADRLLAYEEWDAEAVEKVGRELAAAAGDIWY